MKKKTVFLIVRILISISAFGFLLFIMRDRLGKIQELLVNMKKEFFLLSLFLYLIIPALLSCRLRILLKAQDILFPYRKVN